MITKHYVLIYADRHDESVLLVMKDRPEWQKGFLNLIGGKVEEGESPEEAAVRELKEETGYDPYDSIGYCPGLKRNLIKKCGVIEFKEDAIHCFNISVNPNTNPVPRIGETEIVRWYPWSALFKDRRLMPNLRVIIPLMKQGLCDWKINEQETFMGKTEGSLSVTFPSHLHEDFHLNLAVTNILTKGRMDSKFDYVINAKN